MPGLNQIKPRHSLVNFTAFFGRSKLPEEENKAFPCVDGS